jgi:hypothetical protein
MKPDGNRCDAEITAVPRHHLKKLDARALLDFVLTRPDTIKRAVMEGFRGRTDCGQIKGELYAACGCVAHVVILSLEFDSDFIRSISDEFRLRHFAGAKTSGRFNGGISAYIGGE